MMEKIENTVLKNLIHDDAYMRKVLLSLKTNTLNVDRIKFFLKPSLLSSLNMIPYRLKKF